MPHRGYTDGRGWSILEWRVMDWVLAPRPGQLPELPPAEAPSPSPPGVNKREMGPLNAAPSTNVAPP
jgi:hypothetical protein